MTAALWLQPRHHVLLWLHTRYVVGGGVMTAHENFSNWGLIVC